MANLAEMAKNRDAPWRMAILDGDLVKNGEFDTNGEKLPNGCRYPQCGKYSNWLSKVAPSNYITKEVPVTVRQHSSNTTESNLSENAFT